MAEIKEPVTRMCCVCRERKPTKELIRIAQIDGVFSVDLDGNHNGRGCYVCHNTTCIDKCCKTRALNRSFKCNVDNSIYDELRNKSCQPK